MEVINTVNVTYTIQLIDINDNAPVCVMDLFEGLLEESTVNVKILEVVATDRDGLGGQSITYMVEPSNDSIPFSITSNNGELFNEISLDLEAQEVYRFIVLAIDEGIAPSRTASCNVSKLFTADTCIVCYQIKYFALLFNFTAYFFVNPAYFFVNPAYFFRKPRLLS